MIAGAWPARRAQGTVASAEEGLRAEPSGQRHVPERGPSPGGHSLNHHSRKEGGGEREDARGTMASVTVTVTVTPAAALRQFTGDVTDAVFNTHALL